MKNKTLRILPAAVITTLLLSSCGSARISEADSPDTLETTNYELNLENTDLSAADKQAAYLAYLQNTITENLEALPEIENAAVTLAYPSGTDIPASSEKELFVSVVLDLEQELTTYSVPELADVLAVSVGNTTTDNITILDSEDHKLFPE